MPRNGSGIYSKPADTTAQPNTTIESAKYNQTIDDLVADANTPRPIVAGGHGAASVAGAQTNLSVDNKVVYAVKSGNYTALATDNNAVHRYTATATVTLTAAATLAANWHYTVVANGADITIDPNASETINGFTTLVVPNGSSVTIICDGANFFTASKPIATGALGGFRNQIINGNFDIWQRGTSQTSSGYGADDRWVNGNVGSTKTVSQQSFTPGQTSVPGNPTYFSRTVVTSVAGASNQCNKQHRIENVQSLSGQTATLTFYAKAAALQNIAVEFAQNFGTGGSPSADVNGIGVTTIALTTSWQRFNVLVSIPSISGKALGSNLNSYLALNFWFDAGSSLNSRTNSLGQQSGTFDIAHVSLVPGDARTEADPFSPRHLQQEVALCQRYYQQIKLGGQGGSTGSFLYYYNFPTQMRATPAATLLNAGSLANASVLNDFGDGNIIGAYFQYSVSAGGGSITQRFIGLDSEL